MVTEKDINEQIAWAKINTDVLKSMEDPRKAYWVTVAVCLAMVACAAVAEIIQYTTGMGTANLNDLRNHHVDYLRGRETGAVYKIARTSRKAGLKALPLPARGPAIDTRSLSAVISYKHAAEAAGLGRIGMSSLLVTYKYGPRVHLAICLTEAVLKSTANEDSGGCRYCNICVSKCPSGALGWPEKGERYVINVFACRTYGDADGGCSECMKQCPVASLKYA